MRVALAALIAALLIIADVSYQCADRVRASGRTGESLRASVDDWAFATYLAVVVGLGGVGWAAAAAVPTDRRLGRLTRPIACYGAGAALVCGLGAVAVAGFAALASGVDPAEFWKERYNLECFWLFASALGGLVGSGVGAGLGAAAYGRRRAPGNGTNSERDDYREGPALSA